MVVVDAASAWERAVDEFSAAWQLSARDRTALRVTLNTPMRTAGLLIRELLVEAAGLSLENECRDFAAWCYATCERVSGDTSVRPRWEEVRPERLLVERAAAAVRGGAHGESLVWWSVRRVPVLANEPAGIARERTIASALYLTLRAVEGFSAEDIASRERAGLVAALGIVIVRRLRARRVG